MDAIAQRSRIKSRGAFEAHQGIVPLQTTADDVRIDYGRAGPWPSTRSLDVTQPRRVTPRLGHATLDPRLVPNYFGGDSLGGAGGVCGDGDDKASVMSDTAGSTDMAHHGEKIGKTFYYSGARTHSGPAIADRKLRAGLLIEAARLVREYTTGAEAQVPAFLRMGPHGGSAANSRSMNASTSFIPTPVVPVRGEVVLPSVSGAPKAPKNAVRTRQRGELVYDGPSHLLREQASALWAAENQARQEKQQQQQQQLQPNSPPASAGVASPGGGVSVGGGSVRSGRSQGSQSTGPRAEGDFNASALGGGVGGGRSTAGGAAGAGDGRVGGMSGSPVASLRFSSQFGRPAIMQLRDMEAAYGHVVVTPEELFARSMGLGRLGGGVGGGSVGGGSIAGGESPTRRRRPRKRTAADDKPRFPIR